MAVHSVADMGRLCGGCSSMVVHGYVQALRVHGDETCSSGISVQPQHGRDEYWEV